MSVSGDGKDDINTADIDQDGRNKSDDIGEEVQEPTVQDIAVESAARPKIEAPTAQNLTQYLNSLDNNKPMGLEDIDRKLPPSSDALINETSSEFQTPIVPQFVHIPIDNNATLTTKHRAPSVPDLISYSHSHERNVATATALTNNVPLSNDILSNKKDNRESRKEQFEERLRRAHLRLKSDATGVNNDEEEVTRYRSRSTPSRHLRVDNSNNEGTTDNRRSSLYNSFGHNTTSNGILLPPDASELETSELVVHMSIESSAPEPISPNVQQEVDISNIAVEDTLNSMLVATNSSCKSSHGSRVSDEERNDNILEPPPPPPPATEKERLVERERQARLETERARQRQLALQRDRQSDGDEDENNADLLLGDVSFDARLDQQEMAPEFVGGDNGVVLDLPISSADSSSSIPRPPIPPPPATERERLVERERQARLETERARRRHQALQRERDDTIPDDDNEVNMDESNSVPPTSPQSDMNSGDGSRPRSTTRSGDGMEIGHQAEVPNTEAEANLSYPMERFLDRVDDEEDRSSTLPVDIATEENNAEPSLPYTMELFLADNVAVSEQNESAADAPRSDTNLAHDPNNNESVIDGSSIQPRLEEDQSRQNEPPQAATQSDMSVESINASTDNLPIGDDEIAQMDHPENQSVTSSPFHLSMASSHDTSHHTLHLTEAEIAHLNEVDHASIGNAAPNSVRDEPSEASVSGRVIDHAFSIATQPTAIESVTVTEVSDHRGSIVESDVIRVEGPNISVQNSSSGGASVAAMPSIPSSSDDSSHVSDDSTEGSHDNIGMPRLTEAGIGTLADIENASLGPAPPQSVRDERLSESSVAERGEHQFSSTDPINEISSVERDLLMMDNSDDDDSISDDHSENASVEAMPSDQSDQSVETPRVYHGEHRMHVDSDDEEMIVYQPSIIGSSASIEALPSIDESATHDYGAFHSRSFSRNSVEGFSTMDHQYDRDIESAPLLVPTRNEEQTRTVPPSEPHGTTSQHATITPTLIVGIGTGFAVGLGLGIGLGLVRSLG